MRVDVSLPVIIGTAPVHNLPEGTERPVNKPLLIFSMAEFTAQLGAPGEDETGFTLHEAASVLPVALRGGPHRLHQRL